MPSGASFRIDLRLIGPSWVDRRTGAIRWATPGSRASIRGSMTVETFDEIPTLEEYFATTPREPVWIVPPFLALGALTIFSGPPKAAGKTTLLLQMLKPILSGGSFLGRP